MKFAPKVIIATAAAVLGLVVLPMASQSALAAPKPALAASTTLANKVETRVSFLGSPDGCVSGNFCVYTKGNGGDLCLSNSGNNAYWGDGCANHDQTLFNNGTSGLGVNIYYHSNQAGAYACLSKGDYWLYADQNFFSFVGTTKGREGLNQKVGNNAASHKWSRAC